MCKLSNDVDAFKCVAIVYAYIACTVRSSRLAVHGSDLVGMVGSEDQIQADINSCHPSGCHKWSFDKVYKL